MNYRKISTFLLRERAFAILGNINAKDFNGLGFGVFLGFEVFWGFVLGVFLKDEDPQNRFCNLLSFKRQI